MTRAQRPWAWPPAGALTRSEGPGWLAVAAREGCRLWRALGGGARVGDSSVASTCVHILRPSDPEAVTVLVDRDAGRLFYGRRKPGDIVHLDVFHAPGAMPPLVAAAAFHVAADAYRRVLSGGGDRPNPDAFDMQTAAGGGRVGGALRGGREAGVAAAHRGHVHVAGLLAQEDASFLFFLVAALERALAAQGLSPRSPLRVMAERAGDGLDAADGLRAYAALTDSHLRETGGGTEGAGAVGCTGRDAPQPGAPLASAADGAPTEPAWGAIPADAWLAQAARLADELGGTERTRCLLDALAVGRPYAALPLAGWSTAAARAALARLVQGGWADATGSLWRLTPQGQDLRRVFARHLREVELALRSAARAVIPGTARRSRAAWGAAGPAQRNAARQPVAPRPGDRWGEVAGPETIVIAAGRAASEWAGGTAGPPRGSGRVRGLRVLPSDLRVRTRARPRRVDLCLLLDASASMEGGRMRAARTLARHLLLTGRGRVAVMTFQERACALALPLTRNYAAAERGLRRIAPSGLTPLAAGLAGARRYLAQARAKNPLLLLVTDGIPTAAQGEGSPLDEALAEADRLRQERVSLCCIGLEPNERYLADLVRRAGGRLHVLTELRPESLARLAREERARLESAGGRLPRRPLPERPPVVSAPPREAARFANRG